MLLAVEGGGFFSSSASGYSHGLALLLLGRRTEEQPVRASSWNHYRLVDRDAGHAGQPPPTKDDVPAKCASFTCFGCTPARLEGASPPKLSSSNTRQQLSSSTSRKGTANGSSINGSGRKGCLKSNSKRDSSDRGSIVSDGEEQPRESLEEVQTLKTGMERRKVHWTDTCGKELFEIREFETSDEGLSDDEGENDGYKKCECVIQ